MSLNWREIDTILREAALYGKEIRDIAQPNFEQLLLLLQDERESKRGVVLRISLQAHRVLLHVSAMDMPKIEAPIPRFMQLARARLRGGIIKSCIQYSDQRIVRMLIENRGRYFSLWIRLWSGAANIFLTDEHDMIIDAYFRRPQTGEMSGEDARALIWAKTGGNTGQLREAYHCELRTHPYNSYNEMIDGRYRQEDEDRARKELVRQVIQATDEQLQRLKRNNGIVVADGEHQKGEGAERENTPDIISTATDNKDGLTADEELVRQRKVGKKKQRSPMNSAELQAIGLLLQQAGHRIPTGAAEVSLTDPVSGVERTIPLDQRLSVQQNAQKYFEKYKEKRRAEKLRASRVADVSAKMSELVRVNREAPQMSDDALRDALQRFGRNKRRADTQKCTIGKHQRVGERRFYSNGFTIIVGKSATESEQLMRSVVRGNDMWFHARGVTGSSVFIRHRKGKSVPLTVLYDAATLAHHFSKARGNRHIDVFYTEVKHLRKAKHAPQGTFIPFHDHGLTLDFDEQRLFRLQQSRTYDTI